MAWLRHLPPSARHPRDRWQVRYRDDASQERSAGIYPTQAAANAVKRRLDRGESIQSIRGLAEETGDQDKALLLFGDLDADLIGDWKAKMIAEQLAPQTINAYLALLSTILNAAVDSDYLPRSPMRRKSQAGRAEAVKKEREPRREVWLTRSQLDRVAVAITRRYRALVLAAALTGLRWGELAALRWDDLQLERPFDDGAVAGPGRLRVVRALSDPGNSGRLRVKGPKTEASKRTIALDQETIDAFLAHREL